MPVFRSMDDQPPACSVLTIGNFDGVHLGHQQLLQQARLIRDRQANGGDLMVMTFAPLPLEYLRPEAPPGRVGADAMRIQWLLDAGVDTVWMLPFDQHLATMSATAFVQDLLVDRLQVQHVVVGADFHYGHRRQGDVSSLRSAGAEYGFTVHVLDAIVDEHERISSSRVRQALRHGEVELVARLLGRPYNISGEVVAGQRLGRELGYPTINIDVSGWDCLLQGIYAVNVQLCDNKRELTVQSGADWHSTETGLLGGVASIGHRPVIREHLPERARPGHWLEVHLFDFDQDCYGRLANVLFRHKIRNEMAFASMDTMLSQMHKDCADARSLLGV
ncbi:MAG: bifunctional riboflavin kinase/FAD synthetase [Gammaproteobacteria bacterium]|jgi:riboflavin kinase/FMN adenylyltransferase|nr:bifunctional riboflavin kinase/FAD synthetase [Gammaproteobacteria bacterium]